MTERLHVYICRSFPFQFLFLGANSHFSIPTFHAIVITNFIAGLLTNTCDCVFIGLKFWKIGSRKLYAVKESDLRDKKRSSVINISSSSDEELVPPLVKRRRTAEYVKLSNVSSELREVKDTLEKIFTVTNNMSIPIGLRSVLYDTFKCSICQSTPMVPPIIFAKCCKSILGCQSCVDTWYRGTEGQTRTCPRCRSDRAYVETCKLNGLDDFLTVVAPLLDGNPGDDDDLVD